MYDASFGLFFILVRGVFFHSRVTGACPVSTDLRIGSIMLTDNTENKVGSKLFTTGDT